MEVYWRNKHPGRSRFLTHVNAAISITIFFASVSEADNFSTSVSLNDSEEKRCIYCRK